MNNISSLYQKLSETERRLFGEYVRYLQQKTKGKPGYKLQNAPDYIGFSLSTLNRLRDGDKDRPEGQQYNFENDIVQKFDRVVEFYLNARDDETEILDFKEWLEEGARKSTNSVSIPEEADSGVDEVMPDEVLRKDAADQPLEQVQVVEDLDHSFHENEYVTRAELKRALERFDGHIGSEGADNGDEEDHNEAIPEESGDQSVEQVEARVLAELPSPEIEYDTRAVLTRSLKSFLDTADRVLLFPPFSWQALSIHFCFAAFYAFLAMALVWGLSSFLDLGEVALLPSGSEAATTGRDFEGEEVSDNRFFVLSAVMVVVLVVVVGLIAAYTSVTSTFVQRLGDWIRARTDQLAVGAVIISSVALGLSGMDVRFAVLFCAVMLVAVLLAGRWDRRRLLAFSFPFAFIFSIICVAALGTIWGPMFAAGGVLPVLAFMSLLIGAAAQSKDGTLIAAGVVLVCSLLLAGLNYYVFDGWFRIDPWDPGTVVVLLILPVANGIWDYFSASITRRLSQWALDVTETMEDHKAVLAYIGFVLVDVILAFGTIILLYLCLFSFLNGYNMVAFPDSEGVSLNAFFAGFQESLFSASGLLVVIMLVTVLVPTLIHVHMVSRSMLRVGGLVGNLSALGYLLAMLGCLALLLNAARGILYFLVPAVPV